VSGREIRNARIESTHLGYEGHGILTCSIVLDYGGAMQSFGGYAFDEYNEARKRRIVASAFGLAFVAELLRVVGADAYEKLVGMPCRADASLGRVHRLGNLLRDEWLDPEALAKVARESGELE
jgi:hypothetical protein